MKKFHQTGCEEQQQICGWPNLITEHGARKLPQITIHDHKQNLIHITAEFNHVSEEKRSFRTIQWQLHSVKYKGPYP